MPRGDGTGPFGKGPGTGRGMGRAEGWERGEELVLEQAIAEIVFAPVAGRRFLTRRAFLAIIQVVLNVGQR